MSSRHNGRILAFQTVFSIEFNSSDQDDLLALEWLDEQHLEKFDEATLDFARLLIKGTVEKLDEIDSAIRENLAHWNFDRISKVELAILRISVYSLLYQKSIPASVTINEAVDIAKEFGSDQSYKFINGVLDGVRKNITEDE